jgi:hypothetical protein
MQGPNDTMKCALCLFFSLVLLSVLLPASASAHGGHISPVQTFTQAVGPYELAVTVELPATVPAPLYLVITPQDPSAQLTIRIRAVPRGFPLDGAPAAEVTTYPGTRIYYAELLADRAGDWELDIQVNGAQGDGQVRIPFVITPAPVAATALPLGIALGTMLVLMITNLALTAIARQRGRPIHTAVDRAIGYGIFACLIVAGVLGVQQFNAQSQQVSAATTAVSGRPHVNAALRTEPAEPAAGQPFTLTLDLSDGSTGLPVDDLVSHHEALIHLVIVDEQGAEFVHIHPGSIAPGQFRVPVTLQRAGRYTAYIEVERQDSGTQIIEQPLVIGGPEAPAAPAAPGPGPREIDGLQIEVSSSLQPLRSGRQTTLTLHVTAAGQPVTDIEPWLGMAGHLIARSVDGPIYAHVHAAGAMLAIQTSIEQIAPPSYGPDIQFVYTFPQPGTYQLWAQFQHGEKIVTVPFTLEVGE